MSTPLAIHAAFSPKPERRADFLPESLTQISPYVTSSLLNVFPYLCLADHVLQKLTWSEQADPYSNFISLVIVTTFFVYWDTIKQWFFPFFLSLWFAIVVWLTQSILVDSKSNEKPTLDEIVNVLNNVVTQIDFCVAPFKNVATGRQGLFRLVRALVLLSPLYVAAFRFFVPPRYFLLALVLFGATYHSRQAVATRRLLWRSMYIRMAVFYLTGYDSTRPSSAHPQGRGHGTMPGQSFRIVNKSNISFTQEGQLIEFAILEHQRRWLGLGWCAYLFPSERSPHTTETLVETSSPEKFAFPSFDLSTTEYRWKWSDEQWKTDESFNHGKVGVDGWCYYDNNWQYASPDDGLLKYTRTRKWKRRALLVIDKK
ncbi:hypothetical protein BABINDRAFT_163504 [Babjeviella inositovora NRRL Y-12698]|uniref:Peroxin/Ferlin domain-containing protein n=1 Tax=Babjeviella inositovora NRRL Y-12698 TaxID=984486 RepID=A0A1E3QIF5_9ASCO|nr:uncharacterized protein BABINDRAFT_163504 [Babjeviella inositovora NRRL Y-12698]ODQ77493.1 hypothetical protein BABINDRAFT_163504 [Babjeviella inositovora NRRL Y-12698]